MPNLFVEKTARTNLFKTKAKASAAVSASNNHSQALQTLQRNKIRRANAFLLQRKRKLYADVEKGEMVAVTHTHYFGGLGNPGHHTKTTKGAFMRDDGFNVVLITQQKAQAHVPITTIDKVRKI